MSIDAFDTSLFQRLPYSNNLAKRTPHNERMSAFLSMKVLCEVPAALYHAVPEICRAIQPFKYGWHLGVTAAAYVWNIIFEQVYSNLEHREMMRGNSESSGESACQCTGYA